MDKFSIYGLQIIGVASEENCLIVRHKLQWQVLEQCIPLCVLYQMSEYCTLYNILSHLFCSHHSALYTCQGSRVCCINL